MAIHDPGASLAEQVSGLLGFVGHELGRFPGEVGGDKYVVPTQVRRGDVPSNAATLIGRAGG